jgi:serine/threonine protein kinase
MKNCPSCQASYPTTYSVCPRDGTALVEVGAWEEGAVVRGKYRILGKIGQGGMGTVYKAVHVAFEELRALKVINPSMIEDELFLKRFKHEAIITRRLQHPNAVRVDDIDEAEDGRPFIVMEYIEGRSLKALIQEQGAIPVPRVCSIIKQVSAALSASHALGMVHRDIKPENIVLIDSPQGEQVKVLDFGIAKVKEARAKEIAGSTLTGTGVVIGTPQYMSPEQAMGRRGDDIDGRSDLYSLGVVMYQMLTGELPFKADTTMSVLLAHLQTPPMPIQQMHPELNVPPALVAVVMKTLEKTPERRQSSADELIAEIERAETQPIRLDQTRVVSSPLVYSPLDAAQALAHSLGQAPPKAKARPSAGRPAAIPPSLPPEPEIEPPAPKPPPVARRPSPPSAAPARPAAHVAPMPTAPARKPSPMLWAAIGFLVVGLAGGGAYWAFFRTAPQNTAPLVDQGPGPSPSKPSGGNAGASGQTTTPGASSPASSTAPAATATSGKGQVDSGGTAEVTKPVQQNPAAGQQSTVSRGGQAMPPARGQGAEATTPKPPAVDLKAVKAALAMGDIFYDRGDYDTAISEYQKGLKADPANATLRARIERVHSAKAAEERLRR